MSIAPRLYDYDFDDKFSCKLSEIFSDEALKKDNSNSFYFFNDLLANEDDFDIKIQNYFEQLADKTKDNFKKEYFSFFYERLADPTFFKNFIKINPKFLTQIQYLQIIKRLYHSSKFISKEDVLKVFKSINFDIFDKREKKEIYTLIFNNAVNYFPEILEIVNFDLLKGNSLEQKIEYQKICKTAILKDIYSFNLINKEFFNQTDFYYQLCFYIPANYIDFIDPNYLTKEQYFELINYFFEKIISEDYSNYNYKIKTINEKNLKNNFLDFCEIFVNKIKADFLTNEQYSEILFKIIDTKEFSILNKPDIFIKNIKPQNLTKKQYAAIFDCLLSKYSYYKNKDCEYCLINLISLIQTKYLEKKDYIKILTYLFCYTRENLIKFITLNLENIDCLPKYIFSIQNDIKNSICQIDVNHFPQNKQNILFLKFQQLAHLCYKISIDDFLIASQIVNVNLKLQELFFNLENNENNIYKICKDSFEFKNKFDKEKHSKLISFIKNDIIKYAEFI